MHGKTRIKLYRGFSFYCGVWGAGLIACCCVLLHYLLFWCVCANLKRSFPKHPFFGFPRFFAFPEFSHAMIHNAVSFDGVITRPVSLCQFQDKFLTIIAGFSTSASILAFHRSLQCPYYYLKFLLVLSSAEVTSSSVCF